MVFSCKKPVPKFAFEYLWIPTSTWKNSMLIHHGRSGRPEK